MPKIYLALSNKKDADRLEQAFKDASKKPNTYIKVENKKQLHPLLSTEFDICIVDSELIGNTESIENPNKHMIWHIHPEHPPHNAETEKQTVTLFKDVLEVDKWIRKRVFIDPKRRVEEEGKTIGAAKTTETAKEKRKASSVGKESTNKEKQVEDNQEASVIAQQEKEPTNSGPKSESKSTKSEPNKKSANKEVTKLNIKENGEDIENDYPPVNVDDYPDSTLDSMKRDISDIDSRSNNIKEIYNISNIPNNHVIGVWSPLHRSGVTTFVSNFALYLAKLNIYVAVIEGMTNFPLHKTILKRYTEVPKDWVSYLEVMKDSQVNATNNRWSYQGVNWLPLKDELLISNDSSEKDKIQWSSLEVLGTINGVKHRHDITLMDLPPGKMANYSLGTLNFLNELWIVADSGAYQQLKGWKKYIHDHILSQEGLKVRLIFTKNYSFSKVEQVANYLELDTLVTIPDLTKELIKNQFMSKPLILQQMGLKKLQVPFNTIALELLGMNYLKEKLPYFSALRYKLKKLDNQKSREEQLLMEDNIVE